MISFGNFRALAAAAVLVVSAGMAQAATLTFDTWTDTSAPSSTPVVTITETGANMFSVNYMPAPGSTVVGSLISLYFQVGSLSVASITASNFALTPSALFTTSPSKVAPSAVPSQGNLNGTAFPNASDWTFAILFDKKDNIGAERSLSFDLSATGLDLIDFTRLGLRIQRVGSPGVDPGQRGGSDKLIGIDPTLTSTVPVPAAGLMLLGALGGLAALRRRRKAA